MNIRVPKADFGTIFRDFRAVAGVLAGKFSYDRELFRFPKRAEQPGHVGGQGGIE